MQLKALTGWLAGLGLAFSILLAPQSAAAQSSTIQGMITARDGAQMTVTSSGGAQTVVTLTESTKVVSSAGALGIQRNEQALTDLIAGLPVTVDVVRNGEETDAVKVKFKASDLKTALQVEAGTAKVKAENEALRQRLAEANQYVEKGEVTVLFASGSVAISAQAKADLKAIAAKAQGIKGYLISVVGYADTTGNPDANQRLSDRRAEAVTRYLEKYGGVQPYRVLAHDAMGDAHQVGDAATAAGKAQNRRVVVKILTNKGLEGL
ncbi:MAG TPA: OmpA family protein [Caulobacteraceae bacterium]|nr:OmpA family protein [Caulobacteraceae bacterium]